VGTPNLKITDPELERDLRTLVRFIEVYCKRRHKDEPKVGVKLKTHDVEAIRGRPVALCHACTKLLTHAFVKRSHCPFDPKPACKHCPEHCYHPDYRARIREVMKYSGIRLVLTGRLDYLYHLLF
jgi:hypothetical protein